MRSWKTLAIAAAVVSAGLFALIAANIAAGDPLVQIDLRAAAWAVEHRTPALTLLMLAVTYAHAPLPLCAYAAVIGYQFHRRGGRRWLLALVLAVPLGLVLNVALKNIFQRARPVPGDALLALDTFSFPSGHTAGATLFYGVIAAYLMTRTTDRRVRTACVAGWLSAVALVAFTRVYLGVHYVSDVLGAAAWSLAWLTVSLLIASHVRFSEQKHG